MGKYNGKYIVDYFDLQESLIETLQLMDQAAQADANVKDADFFNIQLYLAGMAASLGNIAGSFDESTVENQLMTINELKNMNLMASFGDASSQIDSYLREHENMKDAFSKLQSHIASIHNPDDGEMSLANEWNEALDDFNSETHSNVIKMRRKGLEYSEKLSSLQAAKTEYYTKIAGEEAIAQIGDDYKKEYSKARIYAKDRFAKIVDEYKKNPNADDGFLQILSKLEEYTKLEATGANAYLFSKEKNMLINASDKLVAYIDRINKDADVVKSISEERANEERIRMAENLRHMLVDITNGSLVVPEEKDFGGEIINPKNHFVNTHDTKIGGSVINFGYAGDPLFPHDPCPEDIQQGWLGDCYLIAGLANLAKNDPQAIKDMMVDNGDGTVTVRFWGNPAVDDNNPNASREKEPIYVTVDKISPKIGSSFNSLWVNMIERAYAASGLHLANDVSGDFMPKDMKAEYERLSKLKPEERPTHIECPWLISASGELKEWKPNYNQIEGGDSSRFLSHVLGPESKNITIDIEQIKESNASDAINYGRTKEHLGTQILIEAMKDLLPPPGVTEDIQKMIKKGDSVAAMKMMVLCTGGNPADMTDPTKTVDGVDLYYTLFENDPNISTNDSDLSAEELFNDHILKLRRGLNGGDLSFVQFGAEYDAYFKYKNAKEKEQERRDAINEYESRSAKMDKSLTEDDTRTYNEFKQELAEFSANTVRYKAEYENLKPTGDAKRRQYREFIGKLCDNIEKKIDKIYGKRYTGNYDVTEKQVYNILKASLDKGAAVNCATHADPDKINVKGLVDNHAYTVAGLVEDKTKQPPLIFVRVRNPHGDGRGGVKYLKDDNGKIRGSERIGADRGYSDIELGDFTASMETIYFNGREVPKEVKDASSLIYTEKMDMEKPANMDVQAYKEYFNALAVLRDNIKSSHGIFAMDSDEFKQFDTQMERALPVHGIGFSINACAKVYKSLQKTAHAYIHHCNEHPKSGSRRALRLYSAKAVVSLFTLMKSGEKRPVEATQKLIAKKLIENEMEKLRNQGKAAAAENIGKNIEKLAGDMITKDAGFKQFIRNQSFTDLLLLSDLDGKTISNAFKEAKTEIKTDHLERQEEQPVNDKPAQAPVNAN